MDEVLVVFYENIPKIVLSFVVGRSKLPFFVGQILNSIIAIILRPREYNYLRGASSSKADYQRS